MDKIKEHYKSFTNTLKKTIFYDIAHNNFEQYESSLIHFKPHQGTSFKLSKWNSKKHFSKTWFILFTKENRRINVYYVKIIENK